MTRRAIKIIGINPGTRYLGIAVLYGQELMDWRIKVLKGKWSKEKMKKAIEIILDVIERYQPNVLSIKKLHASRRSENLLRLANRIKQLSRQEGIKVYQYSINEIEDLFLKGEKHNKRNLAERIASEYPVLIHELGKEKSHKNLYYIRAFEAVALALACVQKLGTP